MKFAALTLLLVVTCYTPYLQAVDEPSHEHTASSVDAKSSPEQKEAEKDETEAFKHSPAVQYISGKTGLSLEGAYWLCVVLNFAVIAGLVFWASKKSLPGLFRNRTASIQQAMADARIASEDANRRLVEVESRLSRLDSEIAEMRAAAEREAAAEEDRLKTATTDEMQKVVASAEQEISAAAKNARRDLRTYAANLVVSLAEKQIKVDAATDQSLVKGFSQRLAADGSARKDAR
jgi:F-type H+-transporting ATPase subunit b